jgi:hypothetical protein
MFPRLKHQAKQAREVAIILNGNMLENRAKRSF